MNEDKYKKIIDLAYELVNQVRAEALVSLRFLDVALYKLKFRFDVNVSIYTDGEYLVMNPYYIFNLYKEKDNALLRNYLHVVLHCIFFHLFINKTVDESRWNLACDMSVENIINELKIPTLVRDVENPEISEINKYKQYVDDFTAEKLYNYFMTYGITNEEVERLDVIFKKDDHRFWFISTGNVGTNDSKKKLEDDFYDEKERQEEDEELENKEHDKPLDDDEEKDNIEGGQKNEQDEENEEDENDDSSANIDGDKNKSDTGDDENPNADTTNKSDINKDSKNEQEREGGENVSKPLESKNQDTSLDEDEASSIQDKINEKIGKDKNKRLDDNSDNNTKDKTDDDFTSKNRYSANIENANYNEWKNISERTKEDLLLFANEWGDRTNTLRQYVREINREKYNYDDFLMKFAISGENIELNDEEFDNIYYTYGLNLYKNVPFVEPLEYKEVKKVKEFAIAIDVSGSVKGDLVQKFIEKTYNILAKRENFYNKINLHIILCDSEIKNDYKITSLDDMKNVIDKIVFEGFGGTDFRPVFKYVDKLIESKEYNNLKGLIYFTDGLGDFPASPPKYDTAFVFIKSDYENNEKSLKIPPWAIKIVLEDM